MYPVSLLRKFILFAIGIACISTGYGQSDTMYFDSGAVKGAGDLKDGYKDGIWVSYFEDGAVRSKGPFNMGFREGEWIWYHENGMVCAIEQWKGGIYRRGEYWDNEGKQSDISEVLSHPEYPGGIEAFTRLIAENIVYPERVKLEGIEGRVVLRFQISPGGRLVNPVITKPAHPELDREALRVVQLSGEWIPAEFHGMKTVSQYTFPITFALQ
jgi:TonB family protein